jgi:hypothetical protein
MTPTIFFDYNNFPFRIDERVAYRNDQPVYFLYVVMRNTYTMGSPAEQLGILYHP